MKSFLNVSNKKFHCPRCGNINIVEYDKSVECPLCSQEFSKEDLEHLNDEDVLSLEEKKAFLDIFGDKDIYD